MEVAGQSLTARRHRLDAAAVLAAAGVLASLMPAARAVHIDVVRERRSQ